MTTREDRNRAATNRLEAAAITIYARFGSGSPVPPIEPSIDPEITDILRLERAADLVERAAANVKRGE